jgi:hypothetical protein
LAACVELPQASLCSKKEQADDKKFGYQHFVAEETNRLMVVEVGNANPIG